MREMYLLALVILVNIAFTECLPGLTPTDYCAEADDTSCTVCYLSKFISSLVKN